MANGNLQAQPYYSLIKYSSKDGLSSMTIADMLQDHKGQLWFATWNGLNKFDGYRFTSYKNSPNEKKADYLPFASFRLQKINGDISGF